MTLRDPVKMTNTERKVSRGVRGVRKAQMSVIFELATSRTYTACPGLASLRELSMRFPDRRVCKLIFRNAAQCQRRFLREKGWKGG